MIFKQLFEPLSSTYTYLLGDPQTGQAILIDPVIVSMERDLGVLHELGLTLAYTLDTHIHADHITAALALRNATGSKIAAPASIACRAPMWQSRKAARSRSAYPCSHCTRPAIPMATFRICWANGSSPATPF
jgi:glyoxylase-like metal-dependent hydrolase (beta-lactamase superfamily II)